MNTLSQHITQLPLKDRKALEERLLEKLASGQKKLTPPAPARGSQQTISFSQEGLWFFDQFTPNSPLYNIAQAFRITGALNVPALKQSFAKVIERHQVLRMNFVATDGKPVPTIRPTASFSLQEIDLRNASRPTDEAEQLLKIEAQKPFHLETDSLIRSVLFQVADHEYVLSIVVHHIVADFSSLVALYRELEECYRAYNRGEEPSLPELKAHFAEWATDQKARLNADASQQKLNYWKEKLSGDLPTLDLPTDFSRPAHQRFKGARHEITLSRELLSQLKELSRKEGTTVYQTLLSGFSVLLHRYSGQHELIVGAPIDQRNTSEAENLIGYFVNMLPLRLKFPENCTFRDALKTTRSVALETFANHEVPFEKLVEVLQVPRSTDRSPLFQVVFQYLPSLPVPFLSGTQVAPVPIHTETSKFDITFTIFETQDGLAGEIEYNTDLFTAGTIERFAEHYEMLLRSAVTAPDENILRLPILSETEKRQVVTGWNDTTTKYPRQACVQELFEEQVYRNPQAIALKFDGRTMTYDDLNVRANQLAHHLRELGVGPDVLVGVAIERSFEMVIGLLAILKAGGAYVPLDPAYPKERLRYIINDTAISVLVTTQKFKDLASGIRNTVFLDSSDFLKTQKATNPVNRATAESLAYVMYTSGSTGKPKGVLIPHRGIVRLVKETNYISFSTNDVFLQFAPLSFDASTLEIWGALLNGARLVVFRPEMPSLSELGDFLMKEEITTLWLTAGLFHQMVDQQVDKLRGLKQLLAGGDVLSVPQVLKALRHTPNCRIINGYGPTENTTFTCCYPVPRDWSGVTLPIGKPISNTTVYILDTSLQPTPIGVPGELYIAGDGLAREYLNAPELNSKKFVPNPFSATGARMYKTGDRARWTADGTIEFLGRLDNQVKVRGFRIEPGEIEAALSQHPEVKETAVLARQNCVGKELVAYVVPRNSTQIDFGDVRHFLQQKLPPYMIPAHFVSIEQFPLNINGKIDRHRLPTPEERASAPKTQLAPRTSAEQRVHDIWSEVLGKKQIDVLDNFFDLGGHSLIATQIISRVGSSFGQEVPLRLLFEFPTIASFAEAISHYRGEPVSDAGPIRKRTRITATRLDQLSDSQIETLFQSSQRKTS